MMNQLKLPESLAVMVMCISKDLSFRLEKPRHYASLARAISHSKVSKDSLNLRISLIHIGKK
jgi:hypothetical protein